MLIILKPVTNTSEKKGRRRKEGRKGKERKKHRGEKK